MYRFIFLLYLMLTNGSMLAADKVINVSVRSVAELGYYPQGSAPASVLSLNDATLSAHINSAIINIPVMVADTVERGDTLLELDCRNAIAIRKSNRASLSLVEYQLQRAKKLRKDNHISEELLRTRESELVIARSQLTISSVDVDRCKIKAPFRGVVTRRIADVGEWVSQGQSLLQLADLGNVEVSAQVPSAAASDLHAVKDFEFVDATARYLLELRAISEVADKASRTREVRLQFKRDRAHPGQSGRLLWQVADRHLPATYLQRRNEQYGVFILKDSKARFIHVPGAQEGRPFKIKLQGDVLVIDKGRHSINDNNPVKISR